MRAESASQKQKPVKWDKDENTNKHKKFRCGWSWRVCKYETCVNAAQLANCRLDNFLIDIKNVRMFPRIPITLE